MIAIKRVYDSFDPEDGRRVLVDRLWPRGVKRATAHIDEWAKELAPSTELRIWYGHRPDRWHEFQARYRIELGGAAQRAELDRLLKLAKETPVTLLYAARTPTENHALVLGQVLLEAVTATGSGGK